MKVLLVEDEERIASFVRKGLEAEGFTVEHSANGDEAYALLTGASYDAAVLDIMLPGRDGLSILKLLRSHGHAIPVVILTARSGLDERVEGLNLGADDYLTKPFYIEELVARLHAVTRRRTGEELSIRQVGDLTVNLLARDVQCGGRSVDLTAREFSLLEYLMRSPGRVYTRAQILEHVWGYHFDPATNIVDVYIKRVRKKLDEGGPHPPIETVRGVGYRLAKP